MRKGKREKETKNEEVKGQECKKEGRGATGPCWAWVTVCGWVIHLSLWPATQANSTSYAQQTENEYQPKCSDTQWLGSKGRCGPFHSWINVWVAGKSVLSLVNMFRTW